MSPRIPISKLRAGMEVYNALPRFQACGFSSPSGRHETRKSSHWPLPQASTQALPPLELVSGTLLRPLYPCYWVFVPAGQFLLLHWQRRDLLQHGPEQPPRQLALRQEQPIVPGKQTPRCLHCDHGRTTSRAVPIGAYPRHSDGENTSDRVLQKKGWVDLALQIQSQLLAEEEVLSSQSSPGYRLSLRNPKASSNRSCAVSSRLERELGFDTNGRIAHRENRRQLKCVNGVCNYCGPQAALVPFQE